MKGYDFFVYKEQQQRTTTKNLCIITWYASINYGTCLQCWGLFHFLESCGYNVYRPGPVKSPLLAALKRIKRYTFKILSFPKKLLSRHKISARDLMFSKLPAQIQEGYRIREKKNCSFIDNAIQTYRRNSIYEYIRMLIQTDVFISGGDQIWNPYHMSPNNMLSFAPNSKKRIAYGSSIGVEHIPSEKEKVYRKYLSKFSAIGIREKTGELELRRILGDANIQTVLDPSFLLTQDDLKNAASGVSVEEADGKKYIFCYFVGGDNQSWMNDVKIFSEKENMPVFCAVSEAYLMPSCGTPLYDLGLQEFIRCIVNAEYIVTDSFHGTALSLNLNKKFAVYKRFSDDDIHSQNSRVTDVLKMFHVEDRLESNNGSNHELAFLKNEIDYVSINRIMKDLRSESIKYLLDSIEA